MSFITSSPSAQLSSMHLLLVTLLYLFASSEIVSAFEFGAAPRAKQHVVARSVVRPARDGYVDDGSNDQVSRRSAIQQGMKVMAFGALLLDISSPRPADAALFGKERRQLDFCLANLLRVTYWAESLLRDLKSTDDDEKRKKVYLEARLGAKALVTGKVGGGATNRVYQLSNLQFRGCLEDIAHYGKSRQVSDLCPDLLEAIAAIVEFDGLESTTDPSPRSSLTLSMYNPKKATYVERLLSERVIPLSKQLFNSFDPDIRQRCEAYVTITYPSEIPS